MENTSVTHLRTLAESLAAISLSHLSSNTRLKLANDDLSVNAYPTDCGGILYVGAPRHRAGIVWLKFDSEAAVIDGLPTFETPELAS